MGIWRRSRLSISAPSVVGSASIPSHRISYVSHIPELYNSIDQSNILKMAVNVACNNPCCITRRDITRF